MLDLLKSKMNDASFARLSALDNDEVFEFVAKAAELCEPESIFVGDDSEETRK